MLLRLADEPPARRNVGALAEWLDVSQPTVSDAVTALHRKGLIRRQTEHAGPHGRQLDLTARGRALLPHVTQWDTIIRLELAALPATDKSAALGVLLDLIAALQRAGVITIARMCATCRFFRPQAHPGTSAPHHCGLLDLPLSSQSLRLDCPDHQPAA